MIDIGWLAQNGPCKIFTAGQTIPCPGGDDYVEKAMYILLVGRVDVTGAGGKASTSITLFPGEVFGGREYFNEKADSTYTAVIDSVVYVLSENSFNDLSWAQPDILFEVLKAAYVPSGKPTAQVRIAEEKEAQAVAVKAKAELKQQAAAKISETAAKTKGAAAARVPAEAPGKAPGAAAATTAETAGKTGGASAPVMSGAQAPAAITFAAGGLFPEGHKSYPGVTKPAYARLVYPKEYTCPFCKKTFTDFKIFSSKLYESAPMRFDLRRFYTDFQTEWYDIITCRHCYFSTVSSYYAESKPVFKQKIENELTQARGALTLDFDAERNIDFVFATHYLAILCADGYLSSAVPLRAKLWGNISWLYEDVGDAEMERYAASTAAAAYEEVYSGTRMTPIQEQTTCLSIAGMQRRAGIDRDLKKYLYQVKTNKMGDKAYVKIAEDIMEDLRISGS